MTRRIVALQLDLMGGEPKPGREWTPSYWTWQWAGIRIPLSDAEQRQVAMLTPDTRRFSTPTEDPKDE